MSLVPNAQIKMLKLLYESRKHQVSISGVNWWLLTNYKFLLNLINIIAFSLVTSETTGALFTS